MTTMVHGTYTCFFLRIILICPIILFATRFSLFTLAVCLKVLCVKMYAKVFVKYAVLSQIPT